MKDRIQENIMRVRFAPSPTGYLHIGNARTAIINHLIAKKYNAEYVLRVEDTDMERSSKESEQSILDDLKWLGIEWTEGPDKGGNYGPYRQSERFDIYKEYTEKLLSEKKAFKCYCTPEEIEQMRKEAAAEGRTAVYNGRCRHLSDDEKKAFENEGRKPTIRFHVEENQPIEINDHIKGNVTFNSSNIGGDFIIVRSDGVPVYNYIVVIDDALMKITDVIRGEDHLPNTPKQIMIARALGFDSPKYAHMPLVLGDDKKKLSKRHGITSVDMYRKEGYLPEALMNYIAMLGWAAKDEQEILDEGEIVNQIDINNLAKSAAVFDFKKLKWMNGNYIRNYPENKVVDLFKPYLEQAQYNISTVDPDQLKRKISFLTNYCELLPEILKSADMFLKDLPDHDDEASELLKTEAGQTAIKTSVDLINSGELNENNFTESYLNLLKEKGGLKGKNLFMPARAILLSRVHGPDVAESLQLLGFDIFKKRILNCSKKFMD